jgi:CheY-like chemotaxis protein
MALHPSHGNTGDTDKLRKAIIVLAGIDPNLYTNLRQTMTESGHSLKMVQGGFELIDAFGHTSVDIVILNDPLPDFSVLKLLKRIRRFPGLANSMVILFTKQNSPEKSDEFFEAGVDKLLTPPVDAPLFMAAVTDLLKTKTGADMGEDADDLAGNLQVIGIVEVLQLLNAGRKTGILNTHTRRGMCAIAINNGEITHAVYGPVGGPDAVYALLKESVGHFKFRLKDVVQEPVNVQMNFASLLLEGMRRNDDAIRQSSSKFMIQSGGTGEDKKIKIEGVDDEYVI